MGAVDVTSELSESASPLRPAEAVRDSVEKSDRRLARRYPIQINLEYRLISQGKVVWTGQGRTKNASSTGILFETECALPERAIIQLRLDWPQQSSTEEKVVLHVAGRTVRSLANTTAVAIDWHEFQMTHARMVPGLEFDSSRSPVRSKRKARR